MPLSLLAILPPPAINDEIKFLKTFMQERFGCEVALRSPAHITLLPPFALAQERTADLLAAAGDVAQTFAPFSLALQHFDTFPPRVIFIRVLPSKTLEQVKVALEKALAPSFPVRIDSRPFHPHVTIANRDLARSDFKPAWEIFRDKRFETSFSATGITLLQHPAKTWEVIRDVPFKI